MHRYDHFVEGGERITHEGVHREDDFAGVLARCGQTLEAVLQRVPKLHVVEGKSVDPLAEAVGAGSTSSVRQEYGAEVMRTGNE